MPDTGGELKKYSSCARLARNLKRGFFDSDGQIGKGGGTGRRQSWSTGSCRRRNDYLRRIFDYEKGELETNEIKAIK